MNVVSLFNGMNTGRQALENVGIEVNKYYSSEIKTYAIELTQHHFPDTIQVGDVTKWREWDIDWQSIDLILSGSPCQDLSAAGKRAGINGSRSSLFFVFVEILEHIKSLNPKVLFLQENVGSAAKLDVGIMSRALGVYPVRINSSLVTAQLRDRYYWSNIRTRQDGMFGDIITDIPQPKDREIMFKDIITDGYVQRVKSKTLLEQTEKSFGHKDKYSIKAQEYIKGREKFGASLVYIKKDKAKALLRCDSKLFIKDKIKEDIMIKKRIAKGKETPNLINNNDLVRTVNQIEMCRLQGFPDNYCDILTTAKAGSLLGDGWTLPIIEHIFSFIKP
jgi:DNA (cytosine-5)-methyltransferase 3A